MFSSKFVLWLALPLLLATCYFLPTRVSARETVSDWYIKDFQSEIVVGKDSSLDITEKITADCGTLLGKHGIFRVLPTQYQYSTSEAVKTPITLLGITDFSGNDLPYSTINDRSNHTVTWKIGDAGKTVTGINYYQIHYKIDNAIRFRDANFDELYWNVMGAFWEIDIDQFSANIKFPNEINKDNSKVWLYSGQFKNKENSLAKYAWSDQNTLNVSVDQTLTPGNAVTASVTFPKNILTPYKFSFWHLYGQYFGFLIPVLVFLLCFPLWKKFGDDPTINSAVAPEFEIPDKLSPLEMGTLYSNGMMQNQYLSASIINLAVKKYLKIEQIAKKGLLGKEDFKFIKLKEADDKLSESERQLFKDIFGGNESTHLSTLKDKFYKNIPVIKKKSFDFLVKEGYFDQAGKKYQTIFIILAVLILIGAIIFFTTFLPILGGAMALTVILLVIFAVLMTKRTQKGAMLFHRIKGLKLYVETAEKYRAQFQEKENIFEMFLPYAIMFGLTKLWIKKMESIYGKEYWSSYHPYWFYGATMTSFNVDSFTKNIESLSSNMATTMASSPSSSGSGGGGFSGGGGGGGGGGGW